MGQHFKIDHKGAAAILRSPDVATAVHTHAQAVANEIRAAHPELDPGVHDYTTDRAATLVAVAGGQHLQATEGLFTRAAAAAGLEVSS